MRLHFKPMPGLTIVTIICLAILISLGTWQYQRLQWKTNLLAEIEEAATSEPFGSVSQIQDALAAGEPVDFRRVGLCAEATQTQTPFHVFQTQGGATYWRPYFVMRSSGSQVFVAGQTLITDANKDKPMSLSERNETLSGYVRLARQTGRFETKSTPEKNRWFGFNSMPESHNWADQVSGDIETRFYIDAVAMDGDASKLPIKRPDIRNNHLDYMLTWYSFAIIMLVIYFILHIRAGRLGYKRS